RPQSRVVPSAPSVGTTPYLFTPFGTYRVHGVGNPAGPGTPVLEPRGIRSQGLGGVERSPSWIRGQHGGRGRRKPSGAGRTQGGISVPCRGDDRRGCVG